MTILDRIDNLLFESRRSLFVTIIIAIELVRTGIWVIPIIEAWREVAKNPFSNPFNQQGEYNFWNWLGPFAAWLVNANGRISFVLFHAFFAYAFKAMLVTVCFQRFSERSARTAIVLFFTLPVSGTVIYLLGLDAITAFLILTALCFRRFAVVTLTLGVLLGMQHFEQGLVASISILLLCVLERRWIGRSEISLWFASSWVLGVILGKIILILIFRHAGLVITGNRLSWFLGGLHDLATYGVFHFHVIIWCAFGPAWGAVYLYTNRAAREIRPFVVVLAFLLCFLIGTSDETRVFGIVSLPLMTVCLLFNEKFKESLSRRTVTLIFMAWVVLPWLWTWSGVPHWSAFPYDVAYANYLLTGHVTHMMAGYTLFDMFTVPVP